MECEWTSHRIGQETDTKETEQVHPQNDIIHLLYNAEYSRHKCVCVRGREGEGGRKGKKKKERREERGKRQVGSNDRESRLQHYNTYIHVM